MRSQLGVQQSIQEATYFARALIKEDFLGPRMESVIVAHLKRSRMIEGGCDILCGNISAEEGIADGKLSRPGKLYTHAPKLSLFHNSSHTYN